MSAGIIASPAFQEALQGALAPVIIGTWVNCFLLMLEWVQAARYYSMFPKDPIVLKAAVAVVLMADLACSAIEMFTVYLYCITHWGDILFLAKSPLPWPFGAYIIATSVTNCIVQSYLVWRVARLTKDPLQKYLLLCVLIGGTVTALGGAIWTSVEVMILRKADNIVYRSAITWLGTSAGTDIAIAAAFIWRLLVMQSSRPVDNMVDGRSSGIILRLVFGAVQTGSATAIIALAALATFFGSKTTTANTAICYIIGRISALTLLINLNRRQELAQKMATPGTIATGYSMKTTRGVSLPQLTTMDESGTSIHVSDADLLSARRTARFDLRSTDRFERLTVDDGLSSELEF